MQILRMTDFTDFTDSPNTKISLLDRANYAIMKNNMVFIEKIIKQCRNPNGLIGRVMGRSMNKEHASMHNWALKQIEDDTFISILDIGCGGGSIVNKLAKSYSNARVFGIDYSSDEELARMQDKSEAMEEECRKKGEIQDIKIDNLLDKIQ